MRKTVKTPRPREWQLQEAKAHFSELFRLAHEQGPQRVTRHGKAAVIVAAAEEFDRAPQPLPKGSIVEFFRNSPLRGVRLNVKRPRDTGRMIDL